MDIIIEKYGFREGLTTRDGKITNWPYDDPQPTQSELDLWITQSKKIKEIKQFCEEELRKSTPQTITYNGNLENKTFKVDVKEHLPLFESIISKLKRRIDAGEQSPTREWTDASGERLNLSLEDFESLSNHLDSRDEQQYAQRRLKIDAINSLNTVEEVEAFNIEEVIV